jgi:hypothetical protein
MKPTDYVIINVNQRKKAVLGKVFNVQHDLIDAIFKDSCDHKFNNFINLYERSRNWGDTENLLYEVKSDFRDTLYLKWNHGEKNQDGYNEGMKFPGYITYMKEPTKGESHKIVDVDIKNLYMFIAPNTVKDFEESIKIIEEANLANKLISSKKVEEIHTMVENIAGEIKDNFNKYAWVGGVFWGGKGFSYWGDWSKDLMDSLAKADLIDPLTNTGERGYHAQRLCSVQMFKPTLVTNYHCDGDYNAFKYCCPAFFMLKGNILDILIDKYYNLNFVTNFKSTISFEQQLKMEDSGDFDIKMWDMWMSELAKIEDDIKTIIFMNEKKDAKRE